MNKSEILQGLGFATVNGDETINYWPNTGLAEYAPQCAAGRERADALLSFARLNDDPLIISRVLKAAGEGCQGVESGVKTGFFQRIAEELLQPPSIIPTQ